MRITTIGIDLAKNVFQVHAETVGGDLIFNRALRRSQMLAFFERLEPCLVGMKACATSHYWAREISKFGHDVRLCHRLTSSLMSSAASRTPVMRQRFAKL